MPSAPACRGGEREINRVVIADTYVTPEDVSALQARVGQVKRKGYEYFRERKVKQ